MCSGLAHFDPVSQIFVCPNCNHKFQPPKSPECPLCGSSSTIKIAQKSVAQPTVPLSPQYLCHNCKNHFTLDQIFLARSQIKKQLLILQIPHEWFRSQTGVNKIESMVKTIESGLPCDANVAVITKKIELIDIDRLLNVLIDVKIEVDEKLSQFKDLEVLIDEKMRYLAEISEKKEKQK